MTKFTDPEKTKTLEVVLNGHPEWCKPEENEAYFLFDSPTGDFQLPIKDVPAFIAELQDIYEQAHTHVRDEEVEVVSSPVKDEDVMERYIEALNRHSEALDNAAYQMSIFDLSVLEDLTETIKVLPTINDMSGNNNRW